jgi:hypothetical protein
LHGTDIGGQDQRRPARQRLARQPAQTFLEVLGRRDLDTTGALFEAELRILPGILETAKRGFEIVVIIRKERHSVADNAVIDPSRHGHRFGQLIRFAAEKSRDRVEFSFGAPSVELDFKALCIDPARDCVSGDRLLL